MSIKKIYLGDFNNEIKNKLFDKSIEYLEENKGDRFLYILANGSLLTNYRKELISRVEKTNHINLFTFDDIANRLAKRVDLKTISEKTKELLLKDIVIGLYQNGEIEYYKNIYNKEGFIKNISLIISNMKSSLIKASDYSKRVEDEDNSFKEIGYIYREYTKLLDKFKLMDNDDKFLHTIDGLKTNYKGFLKDIDFIIIDEFYDFRPQELEIIKEIAKLDLDIYINIPFKRDENFNSLEETIEYLKLLGFKLEEIEKKEKDYYEKLGNNIFSDREKLPKNDNISLTKAPSKEIEIKKVAEIIKKEYKKGNSLDEMAVVVTSDNYIPIINEIFENERIPTSNNISKKLLDIPIVRELFYLLEYILTSNKESFINRLKSKYFKITDEDYIEVIEYNLRNKLLDLEELRELYISEEINQEIGIIFEKIDKEKALFQEKKNIREYGSLVLEIIESYNLDKNIYEIYKITMDYDLFHRDLLALELLVKGLENIVELEEILFNEIGFEEFLNIYYEFLESQEIVVKEGNNRGVRILTPTLVRGNRYKTIFITGLSQGNYPNLSTKNFFFKDENSRIFKKIGLEYRNYYERLDKESLNFSIMLSQVEERLFLSYSEDVLDNESGIQSIFLDELLYGIGGSPLESKLNYIELDLDYLIKKSRDKVTNIDDLYYYALNKKELDIAELEKLRDIDSGRLNKIINNSQGEYSRSKGFDKYSGVLEDKSILKNIENKLEDKIYSISYLENYGKCPYYFFLKNLLRIDDFKRDIEEFTKLDRGMINHKILQDFYTRYRVEIEAYILKDEEIGEDEIEEYLIKRYKEELEKLNIDKDLAIYKLKTESNVKKVFEYILSDLDRLKNYEEKILPIEFEKEFGRQEEFYIEVGDKKIRFTGVIDRIDKYLEEDKYLLMDYKNTGYGVVKDEEILAGTSLQMPVYIMSQEDKNVVGAVYGVISDKKMEILLINEEEKFIIGRLRRGIYSSSDIENILDISKGYIGEYIEKIYGGNFPIKPKECSEYCEYRKICRVREELKI